MLFSNCDSRADAPHSFELEQDATCAVTPPRSSQNYASRVTPNSSPEIHDTIRAASTFQDPNLIALPPPSVNEPMVHPSTIISNRVLNQENGCTDMQDILVRNDVLRFVQHPCDDSEEEYIAFLLGRTISRAIYGSIRQATILRRRHPQPWWTETEERVAVKVVSWERVRTLRSKNGGTRHAEDPIREAALMQRMSQSCGAGGRETPSHVLTLKDLYSDDHNMYMILPYCSGGDFFNVVEASRSFKEPEARYWFRQIVDGLATLQMHEICHRDLSLENLLVSDDGLRVMIMDLGMAIPVPYDDEEDREGSHTRLRRMILPQGICGKPVYISPEVLKNNTSFDGFAVDLWAAAVILLIMLIGGEPWPYPDDSSVSYRSITGPNCQIRLVLEHWKVHLSDSAIDLLSNMLQADPSRRLSLEEVMRHEWVVNGNVEGPESGDLQQQWIKMIE
mmetsp:Transcript_50813/g.99366  ORF Transcript_50813/g.99366 Transcript_50813/m.99366 type:complete len:449 (-) Transcript_50813:69-1415(-)